MPKRKKASCPAPSPKEERTFRTLSGIPVKRLYGPCDKHEAETFPGVYPFTRGIRPTAYRSRLWTMRQYSGYASARETNRRFRYLLKRGQTGLSVAFDLPTQMGYDSDAPEAAGEVGKVGVSVQSLEDMEALFTNIPLERVSTSMTINATAHVLLALYLAVAKKQGVSFAQLRGTVQNDILKEYIARGTYIYPPAASLRLTTDLFAFCRKHVPKWNTISISGYHIREAGATAVEELAFTLADAVTYVEAALRAGLDVDDFAPRLSFFFNGQSDFFEEIAKFRAARTLWAKIMKERFAAKNPRSCQLRFHVQTAGSSLRAQSPYNNLVRVALQVLSAVLGGAQSIHSNSLDEALALPTEETVLLALRTQQLLAYESGAANTADPLGGSWFIESLTESLEYKARGLMAEIEKQGGVLACIESGFIQSRIQESAYRYQRDIENQKRLIVGVNAFVGKESESPQTLRVSPLVEANQKKRLRSLRRRRHSRAVLQALASLKRAARGDRNLLPPTLRAVEAYATLGEISDALREVFGEYRAKEL